MIDESPEGWKAELRWQRRKLEKLDSDLSMLIVCFEVVVVAAVIALVIDALLGG